MIIKEISRWEFVDDMVPYGFSHSGAAALYEYLDTFEEPIRHDPVAFNCEYAEYESAAEAARDRNWDEDGSEEAALGWLDQRGIVIKFDGGIIING